MNELAMAQILSKGSGIGVWTLVLIAAVTLIKGWPALKKLGIEADGSLRRDLFDRIRGLEADLASERRLCDERIRDQDKRHGEAIAELHGELKGLRRQMIQFQQTSGMAMPLGDPEMTQIIRKIDDGEKP